MIEIILNKYLNLKESVRKISIDLGIKYSQAYKILKQSNVEIRSNKFNSLKWTCHDSYFEDIDTPDKAYWLGFIFADGHVTKRNQLFISQTLADIEILEKFKKDIGFTGPINIYDPDGPSKRYGRIGITSEKIISDLRKMNVVENKSLILLPPLHLRQDLVRHFIRGYFDGDGSLTQNKKNQSNFKICGTKEVLTWIVDCFNSQIENIFKLNLYKRRKDDKNNFYISYGGNNKTYKVMKYLYEDSNNTYLNRKYNKYLELKSRIHSRSKE